ncbi:hypothetical protein KJ780_02090, partial [Candidatus Micrarchaeota archaeon]|nr:hypothetical protein [Candidatus Micrarchaeota archaeon]
MNGIQTWGEAITLSLMNLWDQLLSFLPSLIGALLVFVAGWIVAMVLGKVVERILKAARIDQALDRVLGDRLGNIEEHVSAFIGGLVKWFLILVFLVAAANILQLEQVSYFLGNIIMYIPNIVVAVIILAGVILLGNFVYKIVKGSTKAAGVMSATLLAAISKWAIIIFGVFAALLQLGIADYLVGTIITGIVAMLALAGGLAFGLGGKEEAQ